jgi:glutamate--cysteine ligase
LYKRIVLSLYDYFIRKFKKALETRRASTHRIGAELKFPLVNRDGSVASRKTVYALWRYLQDQGWEPQRDGVTGRIVGARKQGELNDTVASCETGYCKTEFSLAHVAHLFDLERSVHELTEELRPFSEQNQVYFLGYGIQPVTPPSKRLLMEKARAGVFDKVFASNRSIARQDGHDLHLFTINAASHVHVSVPLEKAIPAVNVLNGFSGAQIALTANSNIWRGRIDPRFQCVSEKFWDWWMPESERVGVPEEPFEDLRHYVDTVKDFQPIFVKREGKPIIVDNQYETFEELYSSDRAVGYELTGQETTFTPTASDFDLHNTCYWYNARISHYYTVENRVNDQQPPEDLICIAALTLGLVSIAVQANEEISSYDWDLLRDMREAACRDGINGTAGNLSAVDLAGTMLDLAYRGLTIRGLGEEQFLAPLYRRLERYTNPADVAAHLLRTKGMAHLLDARRI